MTHIANITIDHTKVPADLTNFPLCFSAADLSDETWDTLTDSGGSFRFRSADAANEYAREIVEGSFSRNGYLRFDGVDDFATISTGSSMELGTSEGDFIELDIDLPSSAQILGRPGGGDFSHLLEVSRSSGLVRCRFSNTNTNYDFSATIPPAGTRFTVRLQRTATWGEWECFVDGSSAGIHYPNSLFTPLVLGKIVTFHGNFDLYALRVQKDGELVRNYVPRESNGTVALTDFTGTFNAPLSGDPISGRGLGVGGLGSIYVKVPFLSSSVDTALRVYMDGVSADYAVTDPFGRNAVWSDYTFVSHDLTTDSTGTHTLTVSGTLTVKGWRGGTLGRGFGATDGAGSTDNVTTSLTTSSITRTYQCWADSNGVTNSRFFDKQGPGSGEIWFVGGLGESFQKARSGSDGQWYFSTATSGSWRMRHVTYDRSSASNDAVMYLDGAPQPITEFLAPSGVPLQNSDAIVLGNRVEGDRVFDGSMAGFRVRDEILSPEWIATEHANQSSPSTFYTVTGVGGGGSTVGADLQLLADLNELVGSEVAFPSDLRSLVAKDLQLVSAVRALAGSDVQVLSSIAALVGSDLGISSNLASLAGADLQLLADTRSLVGNDLELWSNIVTLSVVGASLQLLNGVRENVGADTVLNARILELIGSDLAVDSNIKALAGRSLQVLSNILQTGTVGADLSLLSGIREHVESQLQLPSQILTAVAADVELLSRILNTAGAGLGIQSSIAALAGADLSVRSRILADVVFRSLKEDGGSKLIQLLHENQLVELEHENLLIQMDRTLH